MKKRLLAMMLVLAAVMMTACGGKTYEKGQYTDTGYESEFLGFRYTTPDGYTLASEEELVSMMGITLDAMGDDVTEAQKKYAELATVFEMMVSDPTGGCNMNMTIDKQVMSVDKYVATLREQVKSISSMDIEINDAEEDVTIAGTTYRKLTASASMYGITMNQEYYVAKVGDRMVSMAVTYLDGMEDGKDTILNGFAAY